MQDTYRHKGMRRRLIEELRGAGIGDERVLAAMMALPRHFFLDKAFEEQAYQNKAFPIGSEQTISQPYTVAFQTALLDVRKHERVLEIGTGSGYQSAILHLLGARVYSTERQPALQRSARERLRALGFGTVHVFLRDGMAGLPEYAPFDAILVTAGARALPEALLQQLKPGGRLVIPIGEAAQQEMYRYTHDAPGQFRSERLGAFRFVPLLPGLAK